jgi:hypothetical protein
MIQPFGVIINWLKPKASINFPNVVLGVDYELIMGSHQCPNSDGSPVTFIGYPTYEWLANYDAPQHPDYDPRLYVLNVDTRPTNTPHPDYPNYKEYATTYQLVKRTNSEIIESIRAEEAAANSALVTEGEQTKTNYLATVAISKQQSGITLDTIDTNALARLTEVADKIRRNANNAANLITAINANQTVDLSVGWEYDNITVGGIPFAN